MVGSGVPYPGQPSHEELAARNAELTARVAELLAVVAEQAALIETLRCAASKLIAWCLTWVHKITYAAW